MGEQRDEVELGRRFLARLVVLLDLLLRDPDRLLAALVVRPEPLAQEALGLAGTAAIREAEAADRLTTLSSAERQRVIREARAMYDNDGVVPPIRIFAKKQGVSTKELYGVFKKGPMKLICKWGGLPKPTGCV